MEVVVTFLGGDQDCPVVTGAVYNATHPVPFSLPGSMTRSGIRTQGTPSGLGYNELSFEDRKGNEQIRVIAQKDMDETVTNDHTRSVGYNESICIGRNRSMSIGGNEIATVAGSRTETVTGNAVETIGGGRVVTVAGAEQAALRRARAAARRKRPSGRSSETTRSSRRACSTTRRKPSSHWYTGKDWCGRQWAASLVGRHTAFFSPV